MVSLCNFGSNLELYVEKWYNRANELCLKMYLEGYNLVGFMRLLQKHYFGYHNSNNVSKLLQKNMIEFNSYYKAENTNQECKLKRNFELQRKLGNKNDLVLQLLNIRLKPESFERSISPYVMQEQGKLIGQNALNEDAGERFFRAHNIEHLREIFYETQLQNDDNSVQLPQKNNIHHLQFEMFVPYPLNIIVDSTCMTEYEIISRYLYLLQYHSKLLDDTWSEINKNKIWKFNGFQPIVKKNIIQKCRITHNKMNQFIKIITEYFTQSVIEKEMSFLNKNSDNSFIDWKINIRDSLLNIMRNCCLVHLIDIQLQVFEIVHKFCKFITSMRRNLCQLSPELYYQYISTSDEDYPDENESSRKLQKLIQSTENVSQNFNQHVEAFIEGLNHYHRNSRSDNQSGNGSSKDTERLISALRT